MGLCVLGIKGIFERFIGVPQAFLSGDPGWIRTSDPQLRRLMLYPAELRGRRTWFSRS